MGNKRSRATYFCNLASLLLSLIIILSPYERRSNSSWNGAVVRAGYDDYYNNGAYGNDNANYGYEYDENAYEEAYDEGDDQDDYKKANDDWDEEDRDSKDENDNYEDRLEDFSYKGQTGFDAVSIMPVSCLNYNNGHMIKFDLFENNSSYQCHFKNLGTFVVSVAHYMRAYFNYEFVTSGDNFDLPEDAGYLTCVQLEETQYSENPLYAKIGCQEKETLVSTRLQLYLYTDSQCSVPYQAKNGGYEVNGYFVSNKVSFRPPFYTCSTCTPPSVSSSFTKQSKNWYDDDVINAGGMNAIPDDQYDDHDDQYFADDQNDQYYADDGDDKDDYKDDDEDEDNGEGSTNDNYWSNWGANVNNDYFKGDDDGGRLLYDFEESSSSERTITLQESNMEIANDARRLASQIAKIEQQLSQSEDMDMDNHRSLMKRGVGSWNMCDRLWRYGAYCDEECRALDTFRVDQWSSSDIFLLIIMCMFMASMMLLVFAKRVKAYERASIYGDDMDVPYPGLPPMAMILLFILIMSVILVLANLKLVNETLVFAVVTCILLFMYMLKLTLFESRGPMLLPAAHRQSALNSMNRQLFD